MRLPVHLSLSTICLAAACSSSGSVLPEPPTVTDTTGATFDLSCADGGCGATPRADSASPGCGGVIVAGRIFVLDGLPSLALGRPAACARDADCPQLSGRAYGCHAGLCESTESLPLTDYDVAALCLAAIPRPPSCKPPTDAASQAALAAAAAACTPGPTCAATPPSCRQP